MTQPGRETLLRRASTKKMRAARLRALGGEDEQFEASLLFREAARDELEALALLEDPSEQEQAGAKVEACGLFLEARDPVRAGEQWMQLPRSVFTTDAGRALLDRLDPAYRKQRSEFLDRWRALIGATGAIISTTYDFSLSELTRLAQDYSGMPELWWMLARRTDDKQSAAVAREHMIRLDASFARTTEMDAVLRGIERSFVQTMRIEMRAEDRQHVLLLDAVSGIAASWGELISAFVEEVFKQEIELRPSSAATGSFVLDVDVRELPPYALAELDQKLPGHKKRPGGKGHKSSESPIFHAAVDLLSRLQKDGVSLAVSIVRSAPGPAGEPSEKLVIGKERRRALLDAAEAEARTHIDSIVVPQADDLSRVFRIVEHLSEREEIHAPDLEITPRQVSYYLHAGRILGFLTDSGGVTPAGRIVARLSPDERLRATVVHFESSECGEAWIQWSRGRTLLDVSPETAFEFIVASVPRLSKDTAKRRAQTLMTWYKTLIPYHYARPDAPPSPNQGRA